MTPKKAAADFLGKPDRFLGDMQRSKHFWYAMLCSVQRIVTSRYTVFRPVFRQPSQDALQAA